LIQLFRNNTPYAVLLLLIVAFFTQKGNAVPPVLAATAHAAPIYSWVVGGLRNLLGDSLLAWTAAKLLFLFLQALYLNRIVMQHRLLAKPTFTPALILICYASFAVTFRHFSESCIANFFLLGAIDAMLQFGHPSQPRRQIFNAGFLLAGAVLTQFSYVFFIPMLLLALLILRPFHPGEWLAAVLGLLTPVYFVAGLLFLYDRLPTLKQWPQLGTVLPHQAGHPVLQLSIVLGVLLLIAGGLYLLQQQMERSTIHVRRGWAVVMGGAVSAILVAFLADESTTGSWMAFAPFFTLIAAPVLETEKPRWFANFALYFLFALTVACRIYL
jgi:hypothetical protein